MRWQRDPKKENYDKFGRRLKKRRSGARTWRLEKGEKISTTLKNEEQSGGATMRRSGDGQVSDHQRGEKKSEKRTVDTLLKVLP